MVTHNSFTAESERYQILSTLSLPEAAVVIDVRHCPSPDEPLLSYLYTEFQDLEAEMRRHSVPGWSQLASCTSFLRLDAFPTSTALDNTQRFFIGHDQPGQGAPLNDMTDFVVSTPSGSSVALLGRTALTEYLCRDVVDAARDARIHAMSSLSSFMETLADDSLSVGMFNTASTIRPTTVRIFFLADMRDITSLIRAATYARWMQERTDEAHGSRRFNRDERLQNIILCLNADSSHYQDTLMETVGMLPDGTIQTIVLLESYAENEAHIDEKEQVYHADLLLYILLLHWPDVFSTSIEDPMETHSHYVRQAHFLPWPTFIIGIAAMEYSARWTARWLDYGIAAQLLAKMTDSTVVENENLSIQHEMRVWLERWWQEMQSNIPDALQSDVDELQALSSVQDTMRPSRVLHSTPRTLPGTLQTLQMEMSQLYTGGGREQLPYALQHGANALLVRWKNISNASNTATSAFQREEERPYASVHRLYLEVQQCISTHYQKVEGAFPRAIRQLEALAEPVAAIQHVASTPPDMKRFQEQFEKQVRASEKKLAHEYPRWTLPVVGSVLRTTLLALLLALILAVIFLTTINWTLFFEKVESLVGRTPSAPSSLFLLIWKVVLMLLLAGGIWMYVSARKRAFYRDCKNVHRQLSETVEQHMQQVKATIAARVALSFLQSSNLYQPQSRTSLYEQRLQASELQLKQLQTEVRLRHMQAETRMAYLHTPQQKRSADSEAALILHNRNEYIQWEQVKQGLIHAYDALKKNGATFDIFTEMLLRYTGTERPEALLNSVLSRHYSTTEMTSDVRFHGLETLFVALALLTPLTTIEPAGVLPLLQEYTALKALKQEEVIGGGASDSDSDLAQVVQKSLIHAIQKQATQTHLPAPPLPSAHEQLANTLVLASWVGRQRSTTPLSTQLFAMNDVLARLEAQEEQGEASMQHSQSIDTLSKQGTLLGHTDDLFGEDAFYLFFAPGEAGRHYLEENQSLQRARTHLVVIPDYEKLVYLRVHRIRQIVSESQEN